MAWYDIFKKVGSLLKKSLGIAQAIGLTEDVVELALRWVRVAANKTVESSEKREWVVAILVAKGIPSSVARIAVELAYQLYLDEIKPKLGS